MSAPDSRGLVEVLQLAPAEPVVAGNRGFVGTTGACPWPKAYGGDMVAQAMVAAMRTVEPGRWLHSMHSYFMRPVEIGEQVHYDVELLRDGRGYSTRQVRAHQNGKVAYVCLASFHVREDGPAAREPEPLDADPDALPSSQQVLADVTPGTPGAGTLTQLAKDYYSTGRSADMRHDPGPVYVSVEGGRDGRQDVWLRTFEQLDEPADGLDLEQTHQAALAWLCDYTIIEPSLRRLGMAWTRPGLATASLDHAMWFHRPARVDQWLRYRQESVDVGDGRALGEGRFHGTDGHLVATVCQEASIRLRDQA